MSFNIVPTYCVRCDGRIRNGKCVICGAEFERFAPRKKAKKEVDLPMIKEVLPTNLAKQYRDQKKGPAK